MKTTDFIAKYKPCADGAAELRKHETIQQAWTACDNVSWMLWLVGRHNAPQHSAAVVQFAKDCAERAKGHADAYADAADAYAAAYATRAAAASATRAAAAKAAAKAAAYEAAAAYAAAADACADEREWQVAHLRALISTP